MLNKDPFHVSNHRLIRYNLFIECWYSANDYCDVMKLYLLTWSMQKQFSLIEVLGNVNESFLQRENYTDNIKLK